MSKAKSATTKKKTKTADKLEHNQLGRSKELVRHKSFRVSKRVKLDNSGIVSPWRVLRETLADISQHKRLWLWFLLSYLPITALLVQDPLTNQLDSMLASNILLVVSLASIWLVRHLLAHETVGVRLAYYRGMTPLIPFVIVMFVFGLQLLFAGAGFSLFQWTQLGGIAITRSEVILAIVVSALVAYPTFYWLPATMMSFYAVTLPSVTPWPALKIGRRLVNGRRWFVYQRLILLGLVFAAIIGGMYLWFVDQEWNEHIVRMLVLTIAALVPFGHLYLYKVYKTLI